MKKYKIPSNHELFTSQTIFDLLVEYHMDYFENNPLEVHRQEDGEIKFTNTGDSLIDKWEEELANGNFPDLTEAFTPESLEKIKTKLNKNKGISAPRTMGDVAKQNALIESVKSKAIEQGLFNPNNYRTF